MVACGASESNPQPADLVRLRCRARTRPQPLLNVFSCWTPWSADRNRKVPVRGARGPALVEPAAVRRATTCSTSPLSKPNAASPRTCTAPPAASSTAPSCARWSTPPTTHCGGRPSTNRPRSSGSLSGPAPTTSTPTPVRCCPPGSRPSTPSIPTRTLGRQDRRAGGSVR